MLYATPSIPVHALVVGVLTGMIALAVVGSAIALLLVARPPLLAGILIVVVAVLVVGLCVLATFSAYVGFVVTTVGVTVIGRLRTWHIRWPEVAYIDAEPSGWLHGATRVHTVDGRVIRAILTAHRYLFFRGESVADIPPAGQVNRPTLIAQDVHVRFRRGEFGGMHPSPPGS